MKRIIYAVFVFCVLVGCKHSSRKESKGEYPVKKISLQEVADVEYIPLETRSDEVTVQKGIKIINTDYRNIDFGLTTHDLEEFISTSDSVNELQPDGDVLEVRQSNRREYLYWLSNNCRYTISGYSKDNQINLQCEDSVVNHEIHLFTWLDSCQYSMFPLDVMLPLSYSKYLKNDSLEIIERDNLTKSILLLNEYEQLFPVSGQFKKYVIAWFKMRYCQAKLMSFSYFSRLKDQRKCEKYKKLLYQDSVLFTQDSLLFMSRYRYVVVLYNDFLAKLNTGKVKSSNLDKYQVAKEYFRGKTKDYLLFLSYRNMLLTKNKEIQSLHFEQDCRDSVWLQEIRQLSGFYNAVTEGRSERFWRSDGQIVSWKELLSSWKGKFVYIDCWASWCEPCRELMPVSRVFAKKMGERNIVFVYFSFDKDIIRWKRACQQEGIGDNRESYCVLDPKEFKEKWAFTSIPYSILLDENGQVLLKQMQTADFSNIEKMLNF